MKVMNGIGAVALVGAAMLAAAPASAQFFWKSKDLSGAPARGDEPGIVSTPMPGASEAEQRASLVWTMRAALNVAALQCKFDPTVLTLDNYNAVLTDHQAELKASFDTLTKYFARTAKTKKEGQNALDQFGTRTYASVTPVASQLNFCERLNYISRDAVFTPRGSFSQFAETRIREMRNAMQPYGEQRFSRYVVNALYPLPPVPRLDAACWNRKGVWQAKKCGALEWPPAGTSVAAS